MANIELKRKSPGVAIREWDPLRVMRRMMRWDPFREMTPIEEELGEFAPDFEIKETEHGFVFTGDLPGTKVGDIEISLAGNVLTIRGKREEEKREEGDKLYSYERRYGSFARSFVLPEAADTEHVTAELKDGVLTVAMPKDESHTARKIEIKSGEHKV